MWRRKPARVLPVPDRRQHRRILTLKNLRNALLVAVGLLVVINVSSEIRKPRDGEYGRIVNRALPADVPTKTVEVVNENSPVDEQYGADPMLLEPAARAQYLGDTTIQPVATTGGAPVSAGDFSANAPAESVAPVSKSKVAVVGGPEGVAVVREQKRDLPKLGGGFGKE